jgi:capsular polysaccharide biosynthesis protein/Flp pilus assembly protein TadD
MQSFIGFNDEAMSYNRQYTLSDETPALITAHEAIVTGLRATIEGNLLEELAGGAFAPDGTLLDAALQPRSDGRNAIKPKQSITLPTTSLHLPKAVFGGIAFDHFGHFLLEATARLWALPELAGLPWLFLTDGRETLKEYQLGFLEVLGLDRSNIVPVADACLIEELVMPAPSFVYHHHATHAYRDTFRRARLKARTKPGRRIFLSRSQTTIALTVGERELEDVLAHDGWEVVIPEQLTPSQQAHLFRDDNVVMGLQGSAMHLGLFAPAGRKVVHLCRGQAYRGYYVLDDLMEADATYFQAMASPPLASKPITGPFLLDLDATLRFLREHELLRSRSVGLSRTVDHATLQDDYRAWWHYTESQIRFHRQIDHDGNAVSAESALASALTAAELRPRNSEILSHAAALTLKIEGVDAAAAVLERCSLDELGDSAADAQLLHFRSMVDDMRGDYPAALAAAERAQAMAPTNPAYTNQKATILYRLGRVEEAEAVINALIASGKAIGVNHYLLSILQEQRGDASASLASAKQAVRLDRHDESLCRRLVALLRGAGEADAARAVLDDFLERNSGSLALRLEMADREQAEGRPDAAVDHLRRAHRIAPDDVSVQQRLLEALHAQKMLPDLSALDQPPNDAVREQSVMIYRRSLWFAEDNRVEEALPIAAVAAGLNPDNETIMQNYLGLMMRAGRGLDARLLIAELIQRGRESGSLLYVLSLIEGELGFAQAARRAARRAAELAPDNHFITEHYQRFGAPAEA